MATANGPRAKDRKKAFLVLSALIGAFFLLSFASGACKSSKEMGKDSRDTYEKGKEVLKEGLQKGGEAAKEGLEKTKEAAKDFSKGWQEGGKK